MLRNLRLEVWAIFLRGFQGKSTYTWYVGITGLTKPETPCLHESQGPCREWKCVVGLVLEDHTCMYYILT